MELNNERILAEKLLLLTKVDYDERLIGEFAEAIRSYRTEIEKEFTPTNKRTFRIDEDAPIRILDKRDGEIQRVAPDTIIRATEREFNSEDKIGED